MLVETAAALAVHGQRMQDGIEQMAQSGSLSDKDVVAVIMDSAQQNYDIAMFFHEIFVSCGMSRT